jgi:hypothetical protein
MLHLQAFSDLAFLDVPLFVGTAYRTEALHIHKEDFELSSVGKDAWALMTFVPSLVICGSNMGEKEGTSFACLLHLLTSHLAGPSWAYMEEEEMLDSSRVAVGNVRNTGTLESLEEVCQKVV